MATGTLLNTLPISDIPDPAGPPKPREPVALLCLGLGLFTAWSALFYLFGALLLTWEAETSLSKADLSLGLTAAIVMSALSAPLAGRLIDAGHGRLLLSGGALLGAAGLAVLALSTSHAAFVLSWAVIGIAQGACLYEPSFTFLARVLRQRARRAISLVSLLGGLSTALAYPAAAFLADLLGWHVTVAIFAVMTALVTAPLMYVGASLLEPASHQFDRAMRKRAAQAALAQARRRPVFWYLLLTFSLLAFAEGMILAHSVPALVELGQSEAAALLWAALIGPSQVVARLGLLYAGLRGGTLLIVSVAALAMATAIVVMTLADRHAAIGLVFAVLFGLGYGLTSVLKPVLVSECLGYVSIGAILGALALPYYLTLAAAPYAGALLWEQGGYAAAIPAAAIAAGTSAGGFIILAMVRSD